MSKYKMSICVALTVIIAVAARIGYTQQQQPSRNELANARVLLAEEIVKAWDQREEAGEALTPSFLEIKRQWAIRLLEARLADAQTAAQRIAAAEDHLARMRRALDHANSIRSENSSLRISLAKYDVADTEYRLAELKSRQ